jgi:hypothetical protein
MSGSTARRVDGRNTPVTKKLPSIFVSMKSDPYNLKRFVDAQTPVYEQVCSELRRGRKTSH